jgi:hypothetical protein
MRRLVTGETAAHERAHIVRREMRTGARRDNRADNRETVSLDADHSSFRHVGMFE